MDYFLEKIALAAFNLATEKGKRIPGNKNHYRGGWKYKNRDFNITAMFADGPDFEGRDLSDCSYLDVSYKGRRVFSHQPWDDSACYKHGIWEEKLEKLTKRLFPAPKRPKDWEDEEAEMARVNRDWAEYRRTHND